MENKTILDITKEVILEMVEQLRILNSQLMQEDTKNPLVKQSIRENAKTACDLLMALSTRQAAVEERAKYQARR